MHSCSSWIQSQQSNLLLIQSAEPAHVQLASGALACFPGERSLCVWYIMRVRTCDARSMTKPSFWYAAFTTAHFDLRWRSSCCRSSSVIAVTAAVSSCRRCIGRIISCASVLKAWLDSSVGNASGPRHETVLAATLKYLSTLCQTLGQHARLLQHRVALWCAPLMQALNSKSPNKS